MLVNLYSSKTPIAVFSLPILTAVLCLPIFLIEPVSSPSLIKWQILLTDWIVQQSWVNYLFTVVLISTTAHQINNVFNRHVFYSKATFLPGLMYVLTLLTFEKLNFSTNLLSHLFLVFALGMLLRIRRQDPAKGRIFWASLFIGLAIGFSAGSLPLVLLPWLTLAAIRPFVWREWFVMLLGAVLPLLYYFSIYYMSTGGLDLKLISITDVSYTKMNLLRAANYAIIASIFIGTLVKYFSVMRTQINRFKKLSQIIFHFSWLSAAAVAIGWYLFDLMFFSFSIPAAFIIGTALLYSKRQSVMNLIVIIWLIISVANVVIPQL
jgi:hypothetical protein